MLDIEKTRELVGRVYFPTDTVGGRELKGFFRVDRVYTQEEQFITALTPARNLDLPEDALALQVTALCEAPMTHSKLPWNWTRPASAAEADLDGLLAYGQVPLLRRDARRHQPVTQELRWWPKNDCTLPGVGCSDAVLSSGQRAW
jgi:hypothetical protein